MPKFNVLAPVALGLAMLAQSASAIPPEGSPYDTDSQQFYVEDVTQEPIEFISHILCYVAATKHPEFVNEGAYNAWLDENICEKPELESESSAFDLDTPKYWTMRVRASRENSSEPHIVRANGLYEEPGEPDQEIYIYAEVYEAPEANNPLDGGDFELQLNVEGMRVILKVKDDKTYFKAERIGESGSQNELVFLQRQSAELGIGLQEIANKQTRFAYDTDHFCRQSGDQKYCFSRSLEQATLMPWRYTRYNSSGEPVQRPDNSPPNSIPIALTLDSGEEIYLDFEHEPYLSNEGLAKLSDARAETLKGARNPNTGEIYELVLSPSTFTLYEPVTRPLAQVSGVRFTAPKDMEVTGPVANYSQFKRDADYEFYWDEAGDRFVLAREIPADPTNSPVIIGEPLSYQDLDTHFHPPGWSPDMDNPRFNMVNNTVTYRKWVELRPGDEGLPTDGEPLECLGDCPKPEWLLNPTGSEPDTVDGGTQGTEPIVYVFHSGKSGIDFGLYWKDGDGNLNPIGWTADLTQWRDSLDEDTYTDYEFGLGFELKREGSAQDAPADLSFNMGPQFWRHTMALRNDSGEFVEVAQPEEVWFDVPNEARYGDQRGKRIGVRITNNWVDGFNGYCYDLDTQQRLDASDCSGQGWAPEAFVPFDSQQGIVTLRDDPDTQYWLKWREAGVLLAPTESDLAVPEWQDSVQDIWDSLEFKNLKDPAYAGPFPTTAEMGEEPKVKHVRD